MNGQFTRKELYDLVWSQPMRTVAANIGISDVALAKHCKKANIPVPNRGYWARKQAGKPTVEIALPPRFPGALDRMGGGSREHYYYNSNWVEKFREMPIPPVPTFDEDMSSVEERARKLVGRVRSLRKFEPAHPLVMKVLSHDEERRREFLKWGSSYNAPKYDAGIERRRLLIVNTLFGVAARLGCRPSMSTSKYGQDAGSERDISISIGQSHIYFTIEPIKSKKENQRERLRLTFGMARDRAGTTKFWEDNDENSLEEQLTSVVVEMLVSAETSYRERLLREREWVIERKAAAEAEAKKRQEGAEREARALRERLAKERIDRLFAQAKAHERADYVRTYVKSALARADELSIERADLERWATWDRAEADRIDPIKNGLIAEAVKGHSTAD